MARHDLRWTGAFLSSRELSVANENANPNAHCLFVCFLFWNFFLCVQKRKLHSEVTQVQYVRHGEMEDGGGLTGQNSIAHFY